VGTVLPSDGVIDVYFPGVDINPIQKLAGRIPAGTFSEIGFDIEQKGRG
jgi:hypothetical protein